MTFMSRRAIALLVVFLAVLVIANVVVIAFWLPRHKTATNAPPTPGGSPVASPAIVSSAAAVNTASSVGPQAKPIGNAAAPGFSVERQVPSAAGNVIVKYLRDRATKTRQIAIQNARAPNESSVLIESKNAIWALVSPDEQWIAVEERKANGEGSIRLFHRSAAAPMEFTPVQDTGTAGLQDTIWDAYVRATQADPGSRRGAAIDATTWAEDSRKLNLSVAYMPGPNNPDVPAPWSCTYDVASKQVEPIGAPANQPDQPDLETASGDDAAASPDENGGSDSFSEDASTASADESEADELPGEKFPATRLDELTVSDVNESSAEDITYAMNEMYARHGAEFTDNKIANQFSEFSWYKPRAGLSLASAEAEFTDLEKANMKVLRSCRDSKVAATRRKSAPARKQQAHEEGAGEKALRAFRLWQDAGAPVPPHP